MIHVRLRHHRGHGRGRVAGAEFQEGVLLPQGRQVVMRPHRPAEQRQRAGVCAMSEAGLL